MWEYTADNALSFLPHSGKATTATDMAHAEHVRAVLECTCSFSCMATTEEGTWPAREFCILTEHLWKWKIHATWIPHVK